MCRNNKPANKYCESCHAFGCYHGVRSSSMIFRHEIWAILWTRNRGALGMCPVPQDSASRHAAMVYSCTRRRAPGTAAVSPVHCTSTVSNDCMLALDGTASSIQLVVPLFFVWRAVGWGLLAGFLLLHRWSRPAVCSCTPPSWPFSRSFSRGPWPAPDPAAAAAALVSVLYHTCCTPFVLFGR